jgi:site-specific DNA-methyltransferase (adenine-specific)
MDDTPNYARMPKGVRDRLQPAPAPPPVINPLQAGRVYAGDARALLPRVAPGVVALSFWSPPYFVGKSYEAHLSFDQWQDLLCEVVARHAPILCPGGFLAVNIADILCFRDTTMPRVQAHSVARRRSPVTRADVLRAMADDPQMNRDALAHLLGCSEQTVDRRLNGNNIRGGKYSTQTRVKVVGGLLEQWALAAGLYPYDRRIWVKDPAWENSKWHTLSYRAVDEFEYVYIFWKPGVTTVDRSRLTAREWQAWGSRAVWTIPSVRANDDHEAKFPVELPRRVIRLLTAPGDLVLDCFLGSGTTAVAAIGEGRQFLGMEKEPRYVDLARRRIRETLRD